MTGVVRLGNMLRMESMAADQSFYGYLRGLVNRTGLTYKEIAAAAGLPSNTVSTFLNGNVQKVHVDMLWRLAPVLKVEFEVLCRMAVGQLQAADEDGPNAGKAAPRLSQKATTAGVMFDGLEPEQQDAVLHMMEVMK
jgi:transcriptional regulator with XRE-family HTH domain